MEISLLVVFGLVSSIYLLARLASIAEQSKWENIERLKEEARLRHLDALYDRVENDESR